MSAWIKRGVLATTAAGLLFAAGVGCGSDEIKFIAPPQAVMQGGVSVSFQKAEADDEKVTVKLFITNLSNTMMTVNRDGFALRLPNGQVIQRADPGSEPYFIPPQQGHNVWVDFEPKGMDPRKLTGASVIIGGVSYVNDPAPRVVGELPLTAAGPKDDD